MVVGTDGRRKVTARLERRERRRNLDYRLALWLWKRNGKERFFRRLDRILRRPSINIVTVVDEMVRRAGRRGPADVETLVLREIQKRMQAGLPVAESMADLTDPVERMLIRGGEQMVGKISAEDQRTGIQRVFHYLSRRLESGRRMRGAVRGAWVNLATYFVLILAALVTFSDYVIPKIAGLYPPADWTGVARSLLVASRVVESTGFAVFVGSGVLTLLILPFLLPYWTGPLRCALDGIPPFSFYRLQEGGAWLASIPALTDSGRIKAYDALVETERLSRPWMRERLQAIRRGMAAGLGMGRAMQQSPFRFPDAEIVADISLFESQGLNIEDILREVAAEWAETGFRRVVIQAGRIEALARIVFALIVLWYTLGTVVLQIQIPNYFMSMAHMG